MILCLDSGNSRIKFGLWGDGRWLHEGALDHADCADLARLTTDWPMPARIMLANVAGAGAEQAIRQALGGWSTQLTVVAASAAAGGVCNVRPDLVLIQYDQVVIGQPGSVS